jgi:predicted RNA polymerase sigma factor
LNRAIAIGQHEGPARGLEELRRIQGSERLQTYPFYPAAFAEFELRSGNGQAAREHFEAAARLARNPAEQRFFAERVQRAFS